MKAITQKFKKINTSVTPFWDVITLLYSILTTDNSRT